MEVKQHVSAMRKILVLHGLFWYSSFCRFLAVLPHRRSLQERTRQPELNSASPLFRKKHGCRTQNNRRKNRYQQESKHSMFIPRACAVPHPMSSTDEVGSLEEHIESCVERLKDRLGQSIEMMEIVEERSRELTVLKLQRRMRDADEEWLESLEESASKSGGIAFPINDPAALRDLLEHHRELLFKLLEQGKDDTKPKDDTTGNKKRKANDADEEEQGRPFTR